MHAHTQHTHSYLHFLMTCYPCTQDHSRTDPSEHKIEAEGQRDRETETEGQQTARQRDRHRHMSTNPVTDYLTDCTAAVYIELVEDLDQPIHLFVCEVRYQLELFHLPKRQP